MACAKERVNPPTFMGSATSFPNQSLPVRGFLNWPCNCISKFRFFPLKRLLYGESLSCSPTESRWRKRNRPLKSLVSKIGDTVFNLRTNAYRVPADNSAQTSNPRTAPKHHLGCSTGQPKLCSPRRISGTPARHRHGCR